MKIFRSLLAVFAVTLIATHASLAVTAGTPEIDPAMGSGALALVGCAIMMIRGRGKA
jgi:hypothetical protein